MLRVPLIRVEGKRYSVHPHLTMTPARFVSGAPLEREARDQVARDAERAFGFEPSLYFFAGIAHPAFGDVVLAYHPEPSTTLAGSATTFDTGGMYLGLIKGRGLSTDTEREAYVAADCCRLDSWRAWASSWIEKHFDSTDTYLDPGGRPRSTDPDDRLGHPDNERRAWAFEVRLHEDRALFDDLAFVVMGQDFLQRALELSLTSPTDNARLLALLGARRIVQVPVPATGPCEEAVAHIQSYVQVWTPSGDIQVAYIATEAASSMFERYARAAHILASAALARRRFDDANRLARRGLMITPRLRHSPLAARLYGVLLAAASLRESAESIRRELAIMLDESGVAEAIRAAADELFPPKPNVADARRHDHRLVVGSPRAPREAA